MANAIRLVLAACLLAVAPHASAADYFVKASGNNANDCTTPETACATPSGALARYVSGSGGTITVLDGSYSGIVVAKSGASNENRLVIRGFTDACPATSNASRPDAMNAPPTKPAPTVSTGGWTIQASHITVDCFRTGGFTILGNDRDNITYRNFVQNLGSVTADSATSVAGMANNVLISNGFLNKAGWLELMLTDSVVELVESFDPTSADYSRIWGERVIWRHNYFWGQVYQDGAHHDCWQVIPPAKPYYVARDITLDGNTCFNAHAGILTEGDLHTGGDLVARMTVINNIFKHGPIGSSMTWCGLFSKHRGVVFSHNTCTSNVGFRGLTYGEIKNNIFVKSSTSAPIQRKTTNYPIPGEITVSGNLFDATSGTYSATNVADTGTFPDNVFNADPVFSNVSGNDYRLTAGSPAIDAGVTTGITTDRIGASRDGKPDIGAYEFGALSPSPEPEPTPDPTPDPPPPPPPPPADPVAVSDDFERPIVTPLGANWTHQTTAEMGIVNGHVAATSAQSRHLAYWSGSPLPSDHHGQVRLMAAPSLTSWAYVIVRAQGASNYHCTAEQGFSYVSKIINGTRTALSPKVLLPWASSDVLRCEAKGSTVLLYRNGQLAATVAVGAELTGGAPGIGGWGGMALDNFSGGQ